MIRNVATKHLLSDVADVQFATDSTSQVIQRRRVQLFADELLDILPEAVADTRFNFARQLDAFYSVFGIDVEFGRL